MAPETFTFACPVCNTRLTVPTSLAGVIGPCPSCGTRIQAPALQNASPAPPAQPATISPPPAPPAQAAQAQDAKAGYRPEPRQLPARPDGKEPIVSKPVSDSMREQPESLPHTRRGGRMIRLLVRLLLLSSAVGVVYAITSYMKAHEPPPRKGPVMPGSGSGSSVRKIQPEDDPKEPVNNDLPPPPPEPDESAPIAPQPPDPTSVDPSSSPDTKPSASVSALRVLEKFLEASSLGERMPFMECRTPQADLEKSCLSKALPERLLVEPAMQTDNVIENFTDFVFKVTFAKQKGGKESYDVLVRRRGDQEPKVVTDPFLDLVGGRLLTFASEPAPNKQGTFQVLVSAYNTCSDKSIPNYEKKISLKLIGEPTGREIVTVYAGKASMIGDMLNDDQSGLGWGRAKACTILLSWNTKDDPGHPYLEASTIKALNWNP